MLTLGRQPSPWDVAFDRTLDFLLSNFSTHDFVWTLPIGSADAQLFGLENVTRTSPIIIYQTDDTVLPQMIYRMKAGGEVPHAQLTAQISAGIFGGVRTFLSTAGVLLSVFMQ